MRRVSQLIEQIRRHTENVQVGVTDGISQQDFVEILNDGQRILQGAILSANSTFFTEKYTFDLIANQAEYDLPTDLWMRSDIVLVEYSHDGRDKEFRKIEKRRMIEIQNPPGTPREYMLRKDKIFISPPPDSSNTKRIRIHYNPRIPTLDYRRGTVQTTDIGLPRVAGDTITTLTVNGATDEHFNVFDDYLSIVDANGNTLCDGIQYDGVSGGVVTISGSGYTLESGESITLGDYVVLGQSATTHSQLPAEAENYLFNYGRFRVFDRDSSTDSAPAMAEAEKFAQMIVTRYYDDTADVNEVPITDYTYHPWSDEY